MYRVLALDSFQISKPSVRVRIRCILKSDFSCPSHVLLVIICFQPHVSRCMIGPLIRAWSRPIIVRAVRALAITCGLAVASASTLSRKMRSLAVM